jgi:predicted RNA binding protein YcfA (HicA-like mRNA interferase family)
MPPAPLLSGREVVRVFEHFGWRVARQRGSHIIMVKGHIATLSIPDHKGRSRNGQESGPFGGTHDWRVCGRGRENLRLLALRNNMTRAEFRRRVGAGEQIKKLARMLP